MADADTQVVDEKTEEQTLDDVALNDALAEFDTVQGELAENPGSFISTKETDDTETEQEAAEEVVETEEADAGTGEQTGQTDVETVTEAAASELVVEEDTAGVYDTTPVDDPGEFTPGDYSFTVTLNDGKTYKIKTPEDAEAIADLADEQPDLLSARGQIALNRGLAKMESGIATDQAKYEEQKQQYDQQQAVIQQRDATLMQINNGMNYLQNKGLLPAIKPELDKADVKWEDHADEPGIKERLALLKYMETENESRMASGLDPSFDVTAAYNGMRLEQLQTQETDTVKVEKEAQRRAGARVAGASRTIQTLQRKGEIVGPGGSLNDLLAEYY